jgi:hypothetical protein
VFHTKSPEIISLKEARKLLGKEAVNLSDDQLIEIIKILSLIAKQYLHKSGSNKALGV